MFRLRFARRVCFVDPRGWGLRWRTGRAYTVRMSMLSVIVMCCLIRSSNEARCCEVKGTVGIDAVVGGKERIVLLKPEEQAFGQCEVLEVGIENLVRLFCCSFWDIKASVIGRLEFRCFPIG